MSAFMHDVARASLPVAIALLAFTVVARAALWADDPALVRVGRQYVEPLSVWCLGVGRRAAAPVGGGGGPGARRRAEEARAGAHRLPLQAGRPRSRLPLGQARR
jgi:hypothetical protein